MDAWIPPRVAIAFGKAIGCPINDYVVINENTYSYWTPGYGLAYKVGVYFELDPYGEIYGYSSAVDHYLFEHSLLHEIGHWLFAGKPQDGYRDWGLGFVGMPAQSLTERVVSKKEAQTQEVLSQIFTIVIGPLLGIDPRIESGEWEGNDSWEAYSRLKRLEWITPSKSEYTGEVFPCGQQTTGFVWDKEFPVWQDFLLSEFADIALSHRKESK